MTVRHPAAFMLTCMSVLFLLTETETEIMLILLTCGIDLLLA